METARLGRTDVELSRLGLGCGNFGGVGSDPKLFGQGESQGDAFALMDAAFAAGITFFDTAASYGGGQSERWVGAWRADRGAEVFLSSKVYWSSPAIRATAVFPGIGSCARSRAASSDCKRTGSTCT